MVDDERRTQYFVVEVDRALLGRLRDPETGALRALAERVLQILDVKAVPERLTVYLPGTRNDARPMRLMFSYVFPDQASMVHFRIGARNLLLLPPDPSRQDADAPFILGGGANPIAHFAYGMDVSVPVHGSRRLARHLMRADRLPEQQGAGVNVAIVDQGLDRAALERVGAWGGRLELVTSWSSVPEMSAQTKSGEGRQRTHHGMMIARNVLDMAPKAKLWDVPIIPDQIDDVAFFASRAHGVIEELRQEILLRKQSGLDERWVVVNAWAVYDRSHEWPHGDYTQNRAVELFLHLSDAQRNELKIKAGHPLINTVGELVAAGADVVFCAGNCGQFSTSPRCTAGDRGQSRSIWGANAHPDVVTVGAISVAANWIGYSSQGPAIWINGPSDRRIEKPDIVAPSHFAEDDDAAQVNTGTSAATALVGGAIAALRSAGAPWRDLTPAQMRARLVGTARNDGTGWKPNTGHGLIDIDAFCSR